MLISFVALLVVKFNVNMAFLKVILLLACDIESNPGPADHKIKNKKSVLGSFHQGLTKFGATAGIQCACIALHSICFSIVKKVSKWKKL